MIIKQNPQYELHATLTPYGQQYSLTLSQIFPEANRPRHQQLLQVLLTDDELAIFRDFLSGPRATK